MLTPRRIVQLLISLVIGGACLWLAFRGVPFDETRDELGKIPWYIHLSYGALLVVQFVIRSWRWAIQAMGVSGKSVPIRQALAINAVAFAAVFLLPFRLGELVRPYLSKRAELMPSSAGLANSAIERIVDGVITALFFGVVILLLEGHELPEYVSVGGWMALSVFGGASVVLVAAVRWRNASIAFWSRVLGLIHGGLARALVGLLERFLDGLACFRTLTAFLLYVSLSASFWILNGLSMWLMLVYLAPQASVVMAYFTLCFLVIAVMIPAPPGNLGNFHYFAKLGLTLVGVAEAPALAFAVVIHGWQVVALILWSGLFIALGDVSFSRLREATASGSDEAAEA